MLDVEYINASKVLEWYMKECQDAATLEGASALEYINLQLASHKALTILNTLQSYPITVTQVEQ